MCLEILIREGLFYGKKKNWDRSTPADSPGARGTKKNGERKGPSQGITQKREAHERNPCAPEFEERSQEVTLQQERCVRRAAWDLARKFYKLKNADKATLYSPIEARATPAPTSKSQETREFVVDSGASMQTPSKKDFSSEEL